MTQIAGDGVSCSLRHYGALSTKIDIGFTPYREGVA